MRAVPVLNLPAFWAQDAVRGARGRQEPEPLLPRRPGRAPLAQRLAHAAFTQLIVGSDAVVDAHAGDLPEALEPFAIYDAGPGAGQGA